MGLPIAHRIDHKITFIYRRDDAWDHDRIKYELAVIDKKEPVEAGRPVPWTRREDHPWWRYVTGRSRGDARTIEDYLKHRDGPEGPVRFHLERIGSIGRWSLVEGAEERGSEYNAQVMALRLSLTAADGLTFEGGKNGEPLTDTDLQALRDTYGDEVFKEIGAFAVKCSRSLTEAEKKS